MNQRLLALPFVFVALCTACGGESAPSATPTAAPPVAPAATAAPSTGSAPATATPAVTGAETAPTTIGEIATAEPRAAVPVGERVAPEGLAGQRVIPAPGPLLDREGGSLLGASRVEDAPTNLLRSPHVARVLARSGARADLAALFDGDGAPRASFSEPMVIALALASDVGTTVLRVRGARDDDGHPTIGRVEVFDGARRILGQDVAAVGEDGTIEWPLTIGGGLPIVRLVPPAAGPLRIGELELVGHGAIEGGPVAPPIDRLVVAGGADAALTRARWAPDRTGRRSSGHDRSRTSTSRC